MTNDTLLPPSFDIGPDRLAARRQEVMAAIGSTTRTHRRMRVLALVLAPAAALLTAAAGYAVLSGDETVAAGIACLDAPTASANVTVIATTGGDPVEACLDLWRQGTISPQTSSPPSLVACVNRHGAVIVAPGNASRVCTEMDMQPLPDDYVTEARRFAAMRDDLTAALVAEATRDGRHPRDGCLDAATATAVARRVLRAHDGFEDWTVGTAQGDYRGRTCANATAFEDREKRVLIIPTERGIDPNPGGPH